LTVIQPVKRDHFRSRPILKTRHKVAATV